VFGSSAEGLIFATFPLSPRIGDGYEPNSHGGRPLLVDKFLELLFCGVIVHYAFEEMSGTESLV